MRNRIWLVILKEEHWILLHFATKNIWGKKMSSSVGDTISGGMWHYCSEELVGLVWAFFSLYPLTYYYMVNYYQWSGYSSLGWLKEGGREGRDAVLWHVLTA